MKQVQVNATPFASLTPDSLLDALESVGLSPDGRLLALNSYENRVYQVFMDDGSPRVVKLYRAGRWSDAAILEEHTFAAELAGRELPVVAPLVLDGKTLHSHGDLRFAVFPRQSGRAPEFDSGQVLEWMGRFIGRIHAVGALKPFTCRPEINIQTFGEEPLSFLRQSGFLPQELAEVYFGVARQALDGVRNCYARAGKVASLRLHGDCHIGNVLWVEGGGPWFVDFDDARMGPAIQDLWMLLNGDKAEQRMQLETIVEAYEEFSPFNSDEIALIEPLRAMRLVYYLAWLLRRWDDPAFPVNFPWLTGEDYWRGQTSTFLEQVKVLQEPPLQLTPMY